MATLTLADGKEINVIRAVRGLSYPILHIYTDSLTASQAAELFDSRPEATNKMVYRYSLSDTEEDVQEEVFTQYTNFSSITKTIYNGIENVIMIRMTR